MTNINILKICLTILVGTIFFTACSSDDDDDTAVEDSGVNDDDDASEDDDDTGDDDDNDNGTPAVTPSQCFNDQSCNIPFVCAHRALCGDEPENTIAAVKQCIDIGVPMIEIDTRETSDGKVVIMHDSDTVGTTDGEERFPDRLNVDELTFDEFKSLVIDDKNCTDPESFPERCHPPSFEEFIAATAPDTVLFLDFKSGEVDTLINEIIEFDAMDRVVIFESNIAKLMEARELSDEIELMPRATSVDEAKQIVADYKSTVLFNWLHIDPGYVADLKAPMGEVGVRLYFDVFTNIDPLVLLARESARPEAKLEEAWDILDKIIEDGGRGFGTNASAEMTKHLYPAGFGVTE